MWRQLSTLLLLLFAIGSTSASVALHAEGSSRRPKFNSRLGSRAWTHAPGGRFKESSIDDLPGSTISAVLVELAPGGMREPHWHDPNEWAYVLRGRCRATLVDQGQKHPVESWDFEQGDVWYFDSNLGHTIVGLAGDENCTYLAGFDQGTFRETRDGRGLSGWLSSAPPEVVAQGLGITEEAVKAHIRPGTTNFITQGDVHALTAGAGSAPVLAAQAAPLRLLQLTTLSHRLPLYSAVTPEVATAGGTVQIASSANLPASKAMSGAIVRMRPGALRQLHWHPKANEWQFIINGTAKVGIYNSPGQLWEFELYEGDAGFAPRGSGHWILNTDDSRDLWIVLIFDSGEFTDVEVTNWIGTQPLQYPATSLGTAAGFPRSWDWSLKGLVPGSRHKHEQWQTRRTRRDVD